MEIVTWLISATWKILVVISLFSVFKAMKNGGKEVIDHFMKLIAMTARTISAGYEKWLFKKYKEVMEEKPKEQPKDGGKEKPKEQSKEEAENDPKADQSDKPKSKPKVYRKSVHLRRRTNRG